jgi:hypothetical protein
MCTHFRKAWAASTSRVVGMILPHLRDPFLALQSISGRCSDTLVITQPCIHSKDPFALFLPKLKNDAEDSESYFAWWILRAVHSKHGRGARLPGGVDQPGKTSMHCADV